mmetsp:Transcript_442/g.1014  ORF Transcript_442/g.1014 Transcript_442/m.1014 type:complete len:294 (+) Transcript_442:558-1439(+)
MDFGFPFELGQSGDFGQNGDFGFVFDDELTALLPEGVTTPSHVTKDSRDSGPQTARVPHEPKLSDTSKEPNCPQSSSLFKSLPIPSPAGTAVSVGDQAVTNTPPQAQPKETVPGTLRSSTVEPNKECSLFAFDSPDFPLDFCLPESLHREAKPKEPKPTKRKPKASLYEVSTEIQRCRKLKVGVHKIFKSPIPSKFCHICGRKPNERRRMIICKNNKDGSCRKITCEACLAKLERFSPFEELQVAGTWSCSHCRRVCPPSAQCTYYSRTNDRRVRKFPPRKADNAEEGSTNLA